MFKYARDRFVPDRRRGPYSFHAVDHHPLNHQCVRSSKSTCNESDFIEPFECERLREQQHRAFRQIQSHMSLELDGGYLLGSMSQPSHDEKEFRRQIIHFRDEELAWPIRMVRERCVARKSGYTTQSLGAELLLDMPNLSNDWVTQILDWSSTGYLTAAIESSIHLWSDYTQSIWCTLNIADANELDGPVKTTIGCLKWDVQGEKLGYSYTYDREFSSASFSDEISVDMTISPAFNTSEDSELRTLTTDNQNAYRNGNDRLPVDLTNVDAWNRFIVNVSDTLKSPIYVPKKTTYIKVWLLNTQTAGSNSEQITSNCGCVINGIYQKSNECCVTSMDWLANGYVLVTGCTRATVTFFRYDYQKNKLITIHVIRNQEALITCLHVSQDKFSRFLAVAFYTHRECVLKVWRMEDPPEYPRDGNKSGLNVKVTESLADIYRSKRIDGARWIIKAFAWHPWKHSLMCYAVVSVNQDPLLSGSTPPSWYVLANACKGQVLKRVEQTTCNSCPTVKILSINTHSMSFSRITGELLVSATRVYRFRKNSHSTPRIVEKHSVVVMHALNRIVETLNSSPDQGMHFVWSPDGSRIALTCSDESLRIWTFWPTKKIFKKLKRSENIRTTSTTCLNTSGQTTVEITDLNANREIIKHNRYQSNQSIMSELSLDASRVIK